LSASDGAVWALVAGAFVLGALCALAVSTLMGRRGAGSDADTSRDSSVSTWTGGGTLTAIEDRTSGAERRPDESERLPHALRSLLLTVVAEALPTGGSALIQAPVTRSSAMVWHIHVDPLVALDVRDGRTISVARPAPTHQWRLPRRTVVQVAQGGPDHPTTSEAVAMRVVGAYLRVTLNGDARGWRSVTASTHTDPRGASDLTADAASWSAVEAALRQAVGLAIGRRLDASPPALGYGRVAWDSHERIWLTASRG
jgi:hypothetical protein